MFWVSNFWVIYVTADGAFPLFQQLFASLILKQSFITYIFKGIIKHYGRGEIENVVPNSYKNGENKQRNA